MNNKEEEREEKLLEGLVNKVDEALDSLVKGDITSEEYSHTLNNIFGTSNLINILRQQAQARENMMAMPTDEEVEKEEVKENVEN